MAWRPPRRVYLVDRWIVVQTVPAETMRDVVADQDGAEGAWDVDTGTIYLLKSLPPTRKARVYAHELLHALVDLLDP